MGIEGIGFRETPENVGWGQSSRPGEENWEVLRRRQQEAIEDLRSKIAAELEKDKQETK